MPTQRPGRRRPRAPWSRRRTRRDADGDPVVGEVEEEERRRSHDLGWYLAGYGVVAEVEADELRKEAGHGWDGPGDGVVMDAEAAEADELADMVGEDAVEAAQVEV
jgi:hypothetical protein